jgi:hypothetical protein
MGTTPTLEHESAAPRLVHEVSAPRMVSFARCENCGSPNVFSTLVTGMAIYWRCQKCDEISVTKRDLL